jgi:XTP/dITP diphosphohydrolase
VDADNNAKLLEEMKGVAHRVAYFVCSIACVYPRRSLIAPFVCNGVCPGEILINPRGNGGFGYDPLFWVDEVGKSMAELTMDEKNAISHRANALRLLLEKL